MYIYSTYSTVVCWLKGKSSLKRFDFDDLQFLPEVNKGVALVRNEIMIFFFKCRFHSKTKTPESEVDPPFNLLTVEPPLIPLHLV